MTFSRNTLRTSRVSSYIGETTDVLNTTPMGKTMDCRLGDALNVLTKNIPMTICTSLAKTLASFTASSHGECSCAQFVLKGSLFQTAFWLLHYSMTIFIPWEADHDYYVIFGPKCTAAYLAFDVIPLARR